MKQLSNYPPGFSGRPSTPELRTQACINGHRWNAQMYDELGGGFYLDEDDADCPTCGQEDLFNALLCNHSCKCPRCNTINALRKDTI
jgi:hypothetical protein